VILRARRIRSNAARGANTMTQAIAITSNGRVRTDPRVDPLLESANIFSAIDTDRRVSRGAQAGDEHPGGPPFERVQQRQLRRFRLHQ